MTAEQEQAELLTQFTRAVQRLRPHAKDLDLTFKQLHVYFRNDPLSPKLSLIREAIGAIVQLEHVHPLQAFIGIGRALAENGDTTDVKVGLVVVREMVYGCFAATPHQVAILAQLAVTVAQRGLDDQDAVVLRDAVQLGRDALELTSSGHHRRASIQGQLGETARQVYEITGDTAALVEAIAAHRDAIQETPFPSKPPNRHSARPDHPYLTQTFNPSLGTRELRASHLASLAADLFHRYTLTRLPSDLDEVEAIYREALSIAPAAGPRRSGYLSGLGRALRLRFAHSRDLSDLDETIDLLSPTEYAELGETLHERFRATGDVEDLRRAMQCLDNGSSDDAEQLTRLATVLATLFERTGDSSVLERAIGLHRRAVSTTSPRSHHRQYALRGLAAALELSFRRHRDVGALSEAVSRYREALACPLLAHHDRVGIRCGLSMALYQLFLATSGNQTAFEEAQLLAQVVAAEFPDGHPDHARTLSPLRDLLVDPRRVLSADRTGSPRQASTETLERSIVLAREAATELPSGHADRATALVNLGLALAERFARSGERVDGDAAIHSLAEAATTTTATGVTRCRASREWARLAAEVGHWPAAKQAYRLAVELLPTVAVRELRRDDQEFQLTPFARLATDAAASVLRGNGAPAEAIELLEQGRGVLLAQAMGSDVGVDISGIDLLTASADAGPIVAVNVSEYGCHALLITRSGVDAVTLPELTHQAVKDHAEAFGVALDIIGSSVDTPDHRWAANKFVGRMLRWLWDSIAEPVLAALDEELPRDSGSLPRLWWMPTGLLSFLPLHAAGYHDGGGQTVLDRVVSSYTPTIRMLRRARITSHGIACKPSRLIVGITQTRGQAPLPGVSGEVELLKRRYPTARVLQGARANRHNVCAELQRSTWAHFACHALSDSIDPSASHLVLNDGPLSVPDIARLKMPNAWLAYLSACATARGGVQLTDEAIHISSAFQLAGYPHVIATLWPITDDLAPNTADAVYQSVTTGPARAVHASAVTMRNTYAGKSPLLWASHIHMGP